MNINNITLLIGRILLAHIFLLAGLNKIGDYTATQAFMDATGVNPILLPAVIAVEVGAGLAIIFGAATKWAALALAGFCVLSAIFFHMDFSNKVEMAMFMKNMALAGGLLCLSVYGPGGISVDAKLGKDSFEFEDD